MAHEWTKRKYADYQCRVAASLRGLTHVSTGACAGCADCGLPLDCTDEERDCATEPHFSWSSCDVCGSSLGGDRHPAHGVSQEFGILHLSVCGDCLYYLNYDCLDDTSMEEVEDDKPKSRYTVQMSYGPSAQLKKGFQKNSDLRAAGDYTRPADSIGHAIQQCEEFINDHRLVPDNWQGAEVFDEANELIGSIDFECEFTPVKTPVPA